MIQKCLTQKTWYSQQSCYYEAMWRLKSEMAKVEIRRNTYDYQSHATISFYDSDSKKWSLVGSIPHPLMDSMKVHAYNEHPKAEGFAADERTLIDEAMMLIKP